MDTTYEKMVDVDYWKSICPDLNITITPFAGTTGISIELGDDEERTCRERVLEEGYYISDAPLLDQDSIHVVAEGIRRLRESGYPPAFIYVFDEPWKLYSKLSRTFDTLLGKNYQLRTGGIWAWDLQGENSHHGFEPHRDAHVLEEIEAGLLPNITIWIPVTDTTPDNGCMYFLPTNLDPNHPDHLDKITLDNPKNVRAGPACAGSALIWTQSIIHWGGGVSGLAKNQRVSVAATFSRRGLAESDSFGENYYDSECLSLHDDEELTLEKRLETIASGVSAYSGRLYQMYPQNMEDLLEFTRNHGPDSVKNDVGSRFQELIMVAKQQAAQDHFMNGRYSDALPLLESLLASNPANYKIKQALAFTLFHLGKRQDALQYLHEVLKHDHNNPQVKDLINRITDGAREP